jgi:hypothetical protein
MNSADRRLVAAMDHWHPMNGFGNSGRLSRAEPFVPWGRSLEWGSDAPNGVGRATIHSIDRERHG